MQILLRLILLLLSRLGQSFRIVFISLGFSTKTLYAPLLFPIRATCNLNLIIIDLTTKIIFGEEYISQSTWLCSFFPSLLFSSHLSWNDFLNTLFSKILRLCSCLNVTDQVSHRYQTKEKFIILVYINICDWKLYSLKKMAAGSREILICLVVVSDFTPLLPLWTPNVKGQHSSEHE